MFTGIVEEVGTVQRVERSGAGARLTVAAARTLEGSAVGASVAVNGVCLTAVERRADGFVFDLGPETLARTALASLAPGARVNLERPLRLGDGLGGHLVLGHVDGVGTIDALTRVESTARVKIGLPDPELAGLLVPQGSVAVDGVSLTVAALDGVSFEVMLIPHTLEATTLGTARTGQAVNIEMDVIGKYVARALALRGRP
jgi:riboflavin synthase